MAFDNDVLRERVAAVCGDRLGLVVDRAWLLKLLRMRVKQGAAAMKAVPLPSSAEKIELTPEFDATQFDLKLLSPSEIALDTLDLTIVVHEEGKPTNVLSRIQMTFREIIASIEVRQRSFALRFLREDSTSRVERESDAVRKTIFDGLGYSAEQQKSFALFEEGLSLLTRRQTAQIFVESVQIPEVIEAFIAFSFPATPTLHLLSYEGHDYLVVRAPDGSMLIRNECPPIDARNEIRMEGTVSDGEIKVQRVVNHLESLPAYSTTAMDRRRAHAALLFAFLPQRVLDLQFNAPPLPAAVFGDSGSAGPVNWQYSVSVALSRLSLEIDAAQPRLILKVDLGISGGASAWIEIACVRKDVGSVNVQKGEVSMEIVVFPVINVASRKLRLNALLRVRPRINIELDVTTVLPWPLDDILGWIASDLATKHLARLTGTFVNLGRFDLADFTDIGRGILPFDDLTYSGKAKSNVLLGLTYKTAELPPPEPIKLPTGD